MSNLNDFNREAKAALWVALQWLLLAVPTGLVCGAVGTAFHLSVEYVTELRAAQSWLLLCLPLAGLAIVALYKVTKCEGVGTNNVIRAVQSGEPVSLLLVPAIFLGTVLTHLCGGSAGREGAALQMGGSIGWNVGKLLHLSDYVRRTATISGMAAFFSALFGTPLTAALFAMMVEDVGLTFTSAFMPAFTSALIAYGVSLFFGIAPTNFVLNSIPHLTLETALQTALLGIAYGVLPGRPDLQRSRDHVCATAGQTFRSGLQTFVFRALPGTQPDTGTLRAGRRPRSVAFDRRHGRRRRRLVHHAPHRDRRTRDHLQHAPVGR